MLGVKLLSSQCSALVAGKLLDSAYNVVSSC
jgi:hypothetical protein